MKEGMCKQLFGKSWKEAEDAYEGNWKREN
jgi:hypothetical protein